MSSMFQKVPNELELGNVCICLCCFVHKCLITHIEWRWLNIFSKTGVRICLHLRYMSWHVHKIQLEENCAPQRTNKAGSMSDPKILKWRKEWSWIKHPEKTFLKWSRDQKWSCEKVFFRSETKGGLKRSSRKELQKVKRSKGSLKGNFKLKQASLLHPPPY